MGGGIDTLIIMFQRLCFVGMATAQYKVTTGYENIIQVSHHRKLFLNIYSQKGTWKLRSLGLLPGSQQGSLSTSNIPALFLKRKLYSSPSGLVFTIAVRL